MDISGMISSDRIIRIDIKSKEDALVKLAELLGSLQFVNDTDELVRAILDREEIMSTGIGQEIAVPHAKLSSVKNFAISLGIISQGIEYDSLDKLPVKIIAMIIAPEGQESTYLKILKKVTEILRVPANREKIINFEAQNKHGEIIDMFRE